MSGLCLHCQKLRACRPRQLCTPCYFDPLIRRQYPKREEKWTRLGQAVAEKRTQPEPTLHPPGSAEKIEVLRQRLECGQELYHPKDATGEGLSAATRGQAHSAHHKESLLAAQAQEEEE